ncbi:type I polyketide synthase [Aspergillus mulundensis]|uniref:Highly reducing polyketide synthase easB n=1 Tax=Aspergillus mulundensis TaxID=1810919 RepID=A0A3D8R017_9EURO|nr:Highly reducing polyketide synthase easB [Aspergillus mulundensis]RDW67402.1 Highly reducing polyketide synthase easB [Aspergillus mulundensis]
MSPTSRYRVDRADSESDSERLSSSPWSVLSDNDSNTSDERGPRAGPGSLEPIAIIGMGCRLSGSATDVSGLWEMLKAGRLGWTPGPGTRFNMKAFQEPTGTRSGTTNATGGHFIREDLGAFDATFFGVNPVEAQAMDPQQRLMLEVAYESFENAGITMDSLWGSNTGVYVGQWTSDYHEIVTRDVEKPPLYLVTGTGPAITSNRVSYVFNLRGPSFTMDTGCSSSLVALHQAVLSLRNGETTQCFVGGVNLLLDPQRFHYQSKLKMFSKDGRSFPFDARANGYGRGEGVTGVVLKPLSAALRDGDPIRAVIKNSVLNQDGRTPGISVPSSVAQKEAIIRAYRQAKLDLYADYVEAHGTGTKVGDPLETSAIAAALTHKRSPSRPLPIGSIKGNIGHTESAAGLAGLIKSVLMLENGMIPPQVNYETTNPDIPLEKWNLRIPTKLERHTLRRISLNSFGYGGTNAHVIIDAAHEAISAFGRPSLSSSMQLTYHSEKPRAFMVSGASEKACQRICARLAKYLIVNHRNSINPDALLARLAHTLAKQSVHAFRVVFVASEIDDLINQLNNASHSAIPRREKIGQPRIALIFSGQGAQYAEMGRDLLKSYPSFVRSLERARQQLSRLGCTWDLLSELCRPKADSRVNEPAFSQPMCTAIQLALVDLLNEFGVSPSAVLGHSSGEIGAAYAAGALSFRDAITVAYYRGRLASELLAENKYPGAMIAVGASPNVAQDHIDKLGSDVGRMRVACFNSPSSVTVSGDLSAIDRLKEVLDAEGLFNRKLMTHGAAYHSHQMELIEEKYIAALKGLKAKSIGSSVRMFSSVTSKELDEDTILDGGYWARNLVSPVLFSQALRALCEQEYNGLPIDTIVEVGPHSQLGGPVNQILKTIPGPHGQATYTNTLKRGDDAETALLRCLGFLVIKNGSVSLNDLNKDSKDGHIQSLVDLPPYSFDHDRIFWHETRLSRDYRHREHLPHELLGSLSADVNRLEPRWRRFLSLKESPWLRNHIVQGLITFPAAGYITMAIQAARQHVNATSPGSKIQYLRFRDVSFGKGLVLSDENPDVEISLSLRPQARTSRESSGVWNEFRIFTVTPDQKWTEHCRGLIQAEIDSVEGFKTVFTPKDISLIDSECTHEVTPQKFYAVGKRNGLDWQHPFNNMHQIRSSKDSCVATARVPEYEMAPGGMDDLLHPAVLDSALFHGLSTVIFLEDNKSSAYVPTFIKQLWIANRQAASGSDLICSTTRRNEPLLFDLHTKDADERMALVAQGVRVTNLGGDIAAGVAKKEACHSQTLVPYVDAWTTEHRDEVCKATIAPGSLVDTNRALDAITINFLQNTLREVSPGDIQESYLQRYFDWMGTLSEDTFEKSLLSKKPEDLGVIGEAIGVLGPHLADILTGKTSALSLLNSNNLLSRVYTEWCSARVYPQMQAYCRELGHFNPNMKVLEVGAGTGSATLPILEALNGSDNQYIQRYDFTDISPGFFEPAKERLGDLANVVEFRVLDASRNVQEQGFEEGSYDLIVACNVIHATPRIDETLRNIRPLLKPGGRFMLMEISRYTLFGNMVFGLFEGWWSGYDEGRTRSPLLTNAEWCERLERAGFANAEKAFVDYPHEDGGNLSVFISTDPLPKRSESLPIRLLTDPSAAMASDDSLQAIQQACSETSISLCPITSPCQSDGIVVMLPELAKLLCAEPDTNVWTSFKNWIWGARVVLYVSNCTMEKPSDAESGLWTGFARTMRLEYPNLRQIVLDIQTPGVPVMDKIAEILPTILSSSSFDLDRPGSEVENEFTERNGQLFVSRYVYRPDVSRDVDLTSRQAAPELVPFVGTNRTLTAELGVPGLLESIRWKDDIEGPPLGPDDVRFELRGASINFKDVLIAAGQLEGITEMRNDCSGVVVEVGENMKDRFKPGDRVCALYSRSYTNYPIVHGDCCQIIPDTLSFAEGASLPIVWATVHFGLVDKGALSKGDKILIHSAAGAVGQASIMLAQHLGAEVFATVGSDAKRDLLHTKYGVPHDHIFSSRTAAFYGGIMEYTGGYGVDVVLNSLSGEMFRESCNVLASFGRFVEIGRKDLMDDALMPMEFLLRNITFSYVDLTAIIEQRKPLARRLLRDVADLAAAGSIRPVTITTMPISDIETAFRQIQAGKHTGKIILTVEEDQQVKAVPSMPAQAQLHEDRSYIVVGGLGGLGRCLTTWLVDHGAKHIVALSRFGAKDADSRAFVEDIQRRGVNLITPPCDVVSPDEVAAMAQKLEHSGLPPVRGIINSAMVLRDTLFDGMTVDDWRTALSSKVRGSQNLHATFKSLDFFVMMSSIVAIRGNYGQSNYSAACSFQDTFVRQMVHAGEPGFSINIGPIRDVGYVSENPEVAEALRRNGMGSIGVSDVLVVLNHAITHARDNDPTSCVASIGLIPSDDEAENGRDFLTTDRRYAQLVKHEGGAQKSTGESVDAITLLSAATQMEEAVDIVTDAILNQLSKLIATPVEMLSASQSLDSYGVDSLVAVELRNWIGAYLQANVQLMVIRGTGSISQLAGIVAKESRVVKL